MNPASPPLQMPASPWSTRDRVLLLCLLGIFAALVHRFWFLTDDAYISFRYSRNLAVGRGLRFNIGEHVPVEGYSNLLWVMLCAGIDRVGLNIEFWPLLVSAACGALLLTLVYRTARLRLGLETTPAFLAGLSFAAFPPMAVWATGGLATMPFALLLFITFERLLLRPGSIHAPSTCLAIVGLSLIRVEGAYWVIALLVMTAIARPSVREPLGFAFALACCTCAATFVGQVVWRNAYYGVLVANTVSAKGGMSLARLARGFDYVAGWTLTMLVPLLIVPAGLVALRRPRKAILWPTVAMACAGFAYAVLVSGDYMTFGRFMIPFWPFNVLLLGILWQALAARTNRVTAIALASTCVVVGALPGWDVHLVPFSVRERFHFRHNTTRHASEFDQWVQQRNSSQLWAARGRAIKRWLEPGSSIVIDNGIGAISFYSELFIFDRGGLVTRETVERPHLEERLSSPGHDMTKPAKFFLKDRPDTMNVKWTVRRAVAAQVKKTRKRLAGQGPEASENYVVDFRPVPDWDAPTPQTYMVYARRLAEGESLEEVNKHVNRRLADLKRGISPYLDVVMDGYPLPPWYRAETTAGATR